MKRLLIFAFALLVPTVDWRLHAQQTDLANVGRVMPSKIVEPCVDQTTRDERASEDPAIPVADWAASGDMSQIPWTTKFGSPELRIDQRYELSYSTTIQSKDLGWSSDDQQLLYV